MQAGGAIRLPFLCGGYYAGPHSTVTDKSTSTTTERRLLIENFFNEQRILRKKQDYIPKMSLTVLVPSPWEMHSFYETG
jgi:hypothetical protein